VLWCKEALKKDHRRCGRETGKYGSEKDHAPVITPDGLCTFSEEGNEKFP
jgi:hypothetical protein